MEYLKKYENYDDESVSKWYLESDYKERKRIYVWDTIEYLTGYFGIGKRFNGNTLSKLIGQYFDFKNGKGKFPENIDLKIARQMDADKKDGDFIDEHMDVIMNILELIWDGE